MEKILPLCLLWKDKRALSVNGYLGQQCRHKLPQAIDVVHDIYKQSAFISTYLVYECTLTDIHKVHDESSIVVVM